MELICGGYLFLRFWPGILIFNHVFGILAWTLSNKNIKQKIRHAVSCLYKLSVMYIGEMPELDSNLSIWITRRQLLPLCYTASFVTNVLILSQNYFVPNYCLKFGFCAILEKLPMCVEEGGGGIRNTFTPLIQGP